MTTGTMECPDCHKRHNRKAKHCGDCGTKLKQIRLHKQQYVKVFVTDETKEELMVKATIASMPLSKYLKTAGLQEEIKPPIPADVRKNIAGWSRLYNQIAHHCNETGVVDLAGLAELRKQATEIITLIKKETR